MKVFVVIVSLLLAVTFTVLAANAWNTACFVSFDYSGSKVLRQWNACEAEIVRVQGMKLRSLDGRPDTLADNMASALVSIKHKTIGYVAAAVLGWIVVLIATVLLFRTPKA